MSTSLKQLGTNRWSGIIVVAVVIAFALGAAAMASRDTSNTMHQGPNTAPGWWDESWDRMGMGSPGVTSEPEFLAEMVGHHREAVVAAGALDRSDRADMRAFGEAIVRTQSAQIDQMEAWLHNWYPEQPAADDRPMMRDLSGLSGDDLDRAFLRDMISHHMTAVMMSQHLLWSGAVHDDLAQLARSIRDGQHTEIIRMQRWLSEWFDRDWYGSGMMMRPRITR